jgi:alpha-galactosidase
VGCDVGLDWDDKPFMRLLHRERVSTKNSLANTRGRAHLDGRAFGCDPDVFFLRGGDVKLSDAQKLELLWADASLGSVFLTSDDMGAWNAGQLLRYRKELSGFCKRRG